jgi:hypothetical protein
MPKKRICAKEKDMKLKMTKRKQKTKVRKWSKNEKETNSQTTKE